MLEVFILRLLVTGAAGMLGSSLAALSPSGGTEIVYTDIRKHPLYDVGFLDVRRYGDFKEIAKRVNPTHILHFAAETSLEKCELDHDLAWSTNALGAQNAALVARSLNVPLAYISTAGVFDGKKEEPYTEYDLPAPIMTYGRSKLEGETQARAIWPETYVIRAGWMVGGLEREHKFVSLIVNQIKSGVRLIRAVNDKFGTPTYAPRFAATLLWLIQTGWYGTYHLACQGGGTRYDVAKYIVQRLGYADVVEVEPVPSSFFQDEYFAPRPRSEMMRNYNLELRGHQPMPTWHDALSEYLANDYFVEMSVAR